MRRLALPLVTCVVAAALVASPPSAGSAGAVAPVLCSGIGTVGPITSPDAFTDAVDAVNLGTCDTIDFSASITFTSPPTAIAPDDSLTSLTITGPAAGGVTLDGSSVSGIVVTLSPAQTLTVTDLTFTDFTNAGDGGALRVVGGSALTIERATFTDNTAASGGAIHAGAGTSVDISDSQFSGNSATTAGGAIQAGGALVSRASSYEGNRAEGAGAISVAGSMTSTGDTFAGNEAIGHDGGAVAVGGTLTSEHATFTGNRASHATGDGGAIDAAAVIDTGSVFSGNEAGQFGGAIRSVGPGAGGGAAVTLASSVLTGNVSGRSGGAVWSAGLRAEGSTFASNRSEVGGAVLSQGALDLGGTDFVGNEASGAPGSQGGAILVWGGYPTTIIGGAYRLNRSGGDGGAIATGGGIDASGDVAFTSNRAGVGAIDGGGAILAAGSVIVTDATFTGNETESKDGGAIRTFSTFTAVDSAFIGNRQVRVTGTFPGNGGAVTADGNVSVTGSAFQGNDSFGAGGALFTLADADITDSSFLGNSAVNDGGAVWARAAAIATSAFRDNDAAQRGGAVFATGSVEATGGTFSGNEGSDGGAISATGVVLSTSSLVGNRAVYGGALAVATVDITNATFDGNTARVLGSAVHLTGSTGGTIRFSTLRTTGGGPFPYGSVISTGFGVDAIDLTLLGSVLAGPSPVCGYDHATSGGPLTISAGSRGSVATDDSCASPTGGAVQVRSSASLGFTTPITADPAPGSQVLIPADDSALNDAFALPLPSGVTTDQLGAQRDSPSGFTSIGAVQVRPTTVTGPSSAAIAPGSDATFSVTAVPGVGTAATYQWQRSADGTTWTDITGNASALTSVLVLPDVPVSDSGLRFRARVADLRGVPVSSGSALLTVGQAPGPAPATPTVDPSPSPAPATPSVASPGQPGPATSPEPQRLITVVGLRDDDDIVIRGATKGLAGERLRAMVKEQGKARYRTAGQVTVNAKGRFSWRTRFPGRAWVYVTSGDISSNTVRIPARR